MRLLAFTPARALAFNLAYVALLTDDVKLTSTERRTHGKLLDRLEAVSAEAGGQGRTLRPEGADVVIEDGEHTLLLRMFEATPWRPALSREVNAAEDFLRDAPEWHAPATKPELVVADGGEGAE